MLDPFEAPDPNSARVFAAAQVAHEVAILSQRGLLARREGSRDEDGFLAAPPWYYRELAERITCLVTEHPVYGPKILEEIMLRSIERYAYSRQDRLQDTAALARMTEKLQRQLRNTPSWRQRMQRFMRWRRFTP